MLRAVLSLTLLALTAGAARASDVPVAPMEEPPLAVSLADSGPDAAFAAAMAIGDLGQPLGVAGAAWTGGVLLLAVAESMHLPVAASFGGVELRPLVAPDASLSVGLGLRGKF